MKAGGHGLPGQAFTFEATGSWLPARVCLLELFDSSLAVIGFGLRYPGRDQEARAEWLMCTSPGTHRRVSCSDEHRGASALPHSRARNGESAPGSISVLHERARWPHPLPESNGTQKVSVDQSAEINAPQLWVNYGLSTAPGVGCTWLERGFRQLQLAATGLRACASVADDGPIDCRIPGREESALEWCCLALQEVRCR